MELEQKSARRLEAEASARQRIKDLTGKLEIFFSGHKGPVGLEIGCGHGHWLTSMAQENREALWVGVDLITKRIERARLKAEKRELPNVLFLKAEATELLAAWPVDFPYQSVFILYPDPWPKKRHEKNRLTRPAILNLVADKADEGAALYFRTDDSDFFTWTKGQIDKHPRWEISTLPWPHEHGSYFQDLLGIHDSITASFVPMKNCVEERDDYKGDQAGTQQTTYNDPGQ